MDTTALALDPVDELLVSEAAALAGDARPVVAVLDAPGTATGVAGWAGRVALHCDAWSAEQAARAAAPAGTRVETDPVAALTDADLVLLALPKALAALDDWCELIRAHARPDVRVVGGARIKHLQREMNDVLARHFTDVHASRGRRKARVLHAGGLRSPGEPVSYPRPSTVSVELPDGVREIELRDHGSTFARGRVDPGTRLLLSTAAAWPQAADAVDLGCGDGVLAVALALSRPGVRVVATDDSAAACRSATATATANGVEIEVTRAEGLTGRPDGSADLIVCNPPFHQGTSKDSTPALTMLADAGRVLRAGGELWTVFNAHLPYLPLLRSRVGRTSIAARDRSYLVTRTVVTG